VTGRTQRRQNNVCKTREHSPATFYNKTNEFIML